MKKLFVTFAIVVAVVAMGSIGFSSGYTMPHPHGDREIFENTRCMACNGTGFKGDFNCFNCKGSGRIGSY